MIIENDCEDQGFTRIEDGCFVCLPTFVRGKPMRPKLVKTERNGSWWWTCEKCGGSYGAARKPRGKRDG